MPLPAPTVAPARCAGCGRWHDVLGRVIWGDTTALLCGACIAWYRHLRTRPESLCLRWPPPTEVAL
jgi:hypothetical protein